MVTEADRRRVRVEIDRTREDQDEVAALDSMRELRERRERRRSAAVAAVAARYDHVAAALPQPLPQTRRTRPCR
jgi:hypothetical protein